MAGETVLPPGGDDDVLDPALEGEPSLPVELAEVAGAEEPVHEGVRVVGRPAVAGEHADAAGQHLALVREAHGGSRHRDAHRTGLDRPGHVPGQRGGRFGEAVPLDDRQAQAAEEEGQLGVERGGTGQQVVEASTHQLPEPGVEQAVEQGVPEPAGPARP